ncbi:hypothetical protein SAMN04488498_12226 [Mesorhizobium albiziae]|uniref:Uncharacterized protein n=1 Tax=Neomesorhizobium albiziae TaxID=335020 RepID=A0A1I4E7E6_9HYPH|nr:hypothetical protein [Mesorhizobium albiziae]GLS32515.1 hypothetical protein GCM10007937_42250 [Mesorhizobium albiziae]SFL00091.1 hypothetical protein SAMN04488498_12226 [Mesorhizobium albiziae]
MPAIEQTSGRMQKNGKGTVADPALVLSQAWVEAHAQTLVLCLRQQQFEAELALSVGFPSANIVLPDSSERDVSSLEDLEDVSAPTTIDEISRTEAAKASAEHWARWRAKDADLGYSATKEAEQQAADKEQLLLDELARTPASTMAGAIAKLSVVLREIEDNHDASDFPLPHIRSVLEDLTRVTHHNAPEGFRPSSDAEHHGTRDMPVAERGTSGGKK